MRIFRSSWGPVELTDERKQHILLFHPDVASCLKFLGPTIFRPQKVLHSTHDIRVIICYSFLASRRQYLAVVIKLKPGGNFVLTAYLAKKIKRTS